MSDGTDPRELADVAIGMVGRVDERARIDALLGRAETGSSDAVVVAGPAGIGKTVLLDYAVHGAAHFRVSTSAGWPSAKRVPSSCRPRATS